MAATLFIGVPITLVCLVFFASCQARATSREIDAKLAPMLKEHAGKQDVVRMFNSMGHPMELQYTRRQMAVRSRVSGDPAARSGNAFGEVWFIRLPNSEPWLICGTDRFRELWFNQNDGLEAIQITEHPSGCF